jgi:hypothetical protein
MSFNSYAEASDPGARPYNDLESFQGDTFDQTFGLQGPTPFSPVASKPSSNDGEGRLFPPFPEAKGKGSKNVMCPSIMDSLEHSQSNQNAIATQSRQNLLMCSQARVQYESQLPILAQIFLDSGSQRNLISSDLVNRIGSKPIRYDRVVMAGFDAIPKPTKAPVHKLMLHGFYGQTFPIELIELEQIVGGISYIANPYHSVLNEKLIPATILSQSPPDILIGVKDYLHLNVIPIGTLPSGFTRLQSQLGDIIAGEGKVSSHRGFQANQVASPMITVLEEIEDTIYPTWSVSQGQPTNRGDTISKTFQGLESHQETEARVDKVSVLTKLPSPEWNVRCGLIKPDKIARQCFWVAHGRKAVIRNLANRCNIRFKGTSKSYSVSNEPSIPPFRSKAIRVFQNSGFDDSAQAMVKDDQLLQRKPPDRFSAGDAKQEVWRLIGF